MNICITADTGGNLYIGYTTDTIRVQKIDDNREIVWSITIDNTDGWTRPYIAVDTGGNVYMSYEIALGNGETEVAVAKIAADGSDYVWNRSYGTLTLDSSAKVAVDGDDNVVLVFATTGVIAGGTASGGSDIAVFKLNPDGDVLWSLQYPTLNTPGHDSVPVVTVAPSGALLVSYSTTVTGADNMTSSITPSGNVSWTRAFPEITNSVPCFLAGTPVKTRRGIIPIETLVVGDEVRSGKGYWIPVRQVHTRWTIASAKTVPYIIPQGWGVGRGRAAEQFYISPNHCVAVPGHGLVRAARLGLQRAKHLREGDGFLYYNLEVDDWDNIVIGGIEVESMVPRRIVRMTSAKLLEYLISVYGSAEKIPFQECFKRIRISANGMMDVLMLSKDATANRAAILRSLG
jgi:hypothetical protein